MGNVGDADLDLIDLLLDALQFLIQAPDLVAQGPHSGDHRCGIRFRFFHLCDLQGHPVLLRPRGFDGADDLPPRHIQGEQALQIGFVPLVLNGLADDFRILTDKSQIKHNSYLV